MSDDVGRVSPIGPEAWARLPALDAVRGGAVIAMIGYHLCWDLTFFGHVAWPLLSHPAWLLARALILSSFLMIVGASLTLAHGQAIRWRPFGRRLLILVAAATTVSGVTALLMPDSFVFFGVLHAIAVSSLIGLAFLRVPLPWLGLAVTAAVVLPLVAADPLFDAPALRWVGLMSYAPTSTDYVPLLPWFGAVLAGIALGRLLSRRARPPSTPVAETGPAWRAPLVWLGRRSLVIYLVHQPFLFGALFALSAGLGVGSPSLDHFPSAAGSLTGQAGAAFETECRQACVGQGTPAGECARRCACAVEAIGEADLWQTLMSETDIAALQRIIGEIVESCATP